MPSRSDGWLPAKVRDGPPVPCPSCPDLVRSGEWQKGRRLGGLYLVYHDLCAEEKEGAYGNNDQQIG